jgi:hypothetical protein
MDSVILLYCGGLVSDQFELVGMRPHALTFKKLPQFNELVARVRAIMNIGCDLRLYERYDMGGNRSVRRWEHICDRCEAEVHIARLRVGVGEGGVGHNRGKGILCIIYFP